MAKESSRGKLEKALKNKLIRGAIVFSLVTGSAGVGAAEFHREGNRVEFAKQGIIWQSPGKCVPVNMMDTDTNVREINSRIIPFPGPIQRIVPFHDIQTVSYVDENGKMKTGVITRLKPCE